VVVENFSPGTMDRLGLSAESLLELNPRLVYGAATGYGVDGPDRDQLAMDITIQAHSGVMSVTGFPDQPPVKAGVAFVDFLGGTHLYAGVVTALFERERTGVGRIVDVAMIDTIYPTLASNLSGYFRDGFAGRAGNGHGGGALVPYNVYATADGHVAIIVITDQQWRNFCGAIGQPELVDDERFSSNGRRYHELEALDRLIEKWTSARSRDEVVSILQAAKIPVARVRDIGEIVEDRHLHERGAIQRIAHPHLPDAVVPHSPLRFRGTPLLPLIPSPTLGRDNRAIYCDSLGLTDDELDALRADGVV
jgi:crotonobetainyl-CoA:carnitine CoA-transferase CaiB-like acyl-CoA transferase